MSEDMRFGCGRQATLPGPLRLDGGTLLSPVEIAYETYGTLDADGGNAILICHALTGDQHVASTHPRTGKPGCINPATGRPWGMAFPVITIRDMVRAQAMLLDHLGVARLKAVVGGSMGGMQALSWAATFPDRPLWPRRLPARRAGDEPRDRRFPERRAMMDLGIDLDDDKDRLDIARIHGWLASSYWSPGIDRALVERAIAGSHCLGAYAGGEQIGFARAITDHATFAWIADVWIDEAARGKGLGRRMVGWFVDHPAFAGIRRIGLVTADAHGVYEALGFHALLRPDRFMERLSPAAAALLKTAS
ncbi:hypothetical protein WR25_08595 [Diploscapter pachys]|uniref:N-acetyltransferase domain-containing protein n=2 Tax=cellular organisms TaxID=131567 RepID=A0A2A2K5P8_9BILA|nr:hypothetical protein WR25_08595 [Diploscapter pachys]